MLRIDGLMLREAGGAGAASAVVDDVAFLWHTRRSASRYKSLHRSFTRPQCVLERYSVHYSRARTIV